MAEATEGDGDPSRLVFQASSPEPPTPATTKKDNKKSVSERLRGRKSTPRPILKGYGNKRYNLSPSLKIVQRKKKVFDSGGRERKWEGNGSKKNLMEALNDAAAPVPEGTATPALDVTKLVPVGEGTFFPVASPLGVDVKGVGTVSLVASPLFSTPEGAGTGSEVASPQPDTVSILQDSNSTARPTMDLVVYGLNHENGHVRGGDEAKSDDVQMVPVLSMVSAVSVGDEVVGMVASSGRMDDQALVIVEPKGHVTSLPKRFSDAALLNASFLGKGTNIGYGSNIGEGTIIGDSSLGVSIPALEEKNVEANDVAASPKHDLLRLADLESAERLDNLETQPLQPPWKGGNSANAVPSPTNPRIKWNVQQNIVTTPSCMELDEHFPPLERGRTLRLCGKFDSAVKPIADSVQPSTSYANGDLKNATDLPPKAGGVITPNSDASSTVAATTQGSHNTEATPKSLVDIIKGKGAKSDNTSFEPQSLEDLGIAGFSGNLPAIHFSSEESEKLAKEMGYAIVGKFSHSLPTSRQIQRILDSLRFARPFSWKTINAKHILIQFEDLDDYARLLNGPKGTPMWMVDSHPMRVFKWTPQFDLYCESPIAAIWCNIIALPIHLYNKSALFAIGKLFGNPIKIDPATADKTRYSFARLCIEIDITDPPPEEFVLDVGGKETTLKVKWDKIPLYCSDCYHVGHAKERCTARGRNQKSDPNDNNTPQHNVFNPSSNIYEGKQFHQGGVQGKKEWVKKQGNNSFNFDLMAGHGNAATNNHIPDILGHVSAANQKGNPGGSQGSWHLYQGRGGIEEVGEGRRSEGNSPEQGLERDRWLELVRSHHRNPDQTPVPDYQTTRRAVALAVPIS